MNNTKTTAIDPTTGLVLRETTDVEHAAFTGQAIEHPSKAWAFRKAVRVGDVLVDEDTGPGLWFGGAGF